MIPFTKTRNGFFCINGLLVYWSACCTEKNRSSCEKGEGYFNQYGSFLRWKQEKGWHKKTTSSILLYSFFVVCMCERYFDRRILFLSNRWETWGSAHKAHLEPPGRAERDGLVRRLPWWSTSPYQTLGKGSKDVQKKFKHAYLVRCELLVFQEG